jgi:hypothetical protein
LGTLDNINGGRPKRKIKRKKLSIWLVSVFLFCNFVIDQRCTQ